MHEHAHIPSRRRPAHRSPRGLALALALGVGLAAGGAGAQPLRAKAQESGCVDAPRVVEGRTYRCSTSSGAAAYFNVPEGTDLSGGGTSPARRTGAAPSAQPAPTGFPKVDTATQRGRDEMRRKVLNDELASEEKLLAEARTAFGDGAPPATPDERANPQKYADRLGRLRQAVQLHERNIEALRKELAASR
jgi:hypothetical protein